MQNPFRPKVTINKPTVNNNGPVVVNPRTNKPFPQNDSPSVFVPNHQNSVNNLWIKRLLINRTNTYHEQYFRPYESVLDPRATEEFVNSVDLRHINVNSNSAFMPASPSVARLANRFISPSMSISKANDRVNIANGWGEERFIFIMEVVKEVMHGIFDIYVITGFTDRCDYALIKNNDDVVRIAPDTEFYVNNVVNVIENSTSSVSGYTGNKYKIKSVQQTLFDSPFEKHSYNHNQQHTLTPFDVAQRLQLHHLSDNNTKGITIDSAFRNSPNSTRSQSSMKFSRRGNTNPGEYLTRLLGGYKMGAQGLRSGMVDEFTVWDTVVGAVSEDKVRQNHFFNYIRDNSNFEVGKCFTYKDLLHISPEVDDIAIVNVRSKRRNNLNTQYWHGSTEDCRIALRIAHAMPSLLTSCLLESISFEVNNYSINNDYNIIISHDEERQPKVFIEGTDDVELVNMFITRLRNEVLNGITENDAIDISLIVDASLTDEIYMEISFNGEPYVEYASPTFADNITSPVICNSDSNVRADNIAGDLNNLFSAMDDSDYMPVPERANSFNNFQ